MTVPKKYTVVVDPRYEELRRAYYEAENILEWIYRETKHTPLLTDGTIQKVREHIKKQNKPKRIYPGVSG